MGIITDKFSVKGKTIIITGGASGIGKCVAGALASEGANIAIIDMQLALAKEVVDSISSEYQIKAEAYFCDVTDSVQVETTIKAIAVDFGRIDSVFNNAGICMHKPASEASPNEWLTVINVNLNGAFFVAREVGKYFIQNQIKGTIVSTASMSGSIVNIPQKQTSYNASKAAVIHMTKSLAVEWAEYGIRVNCISPGYIFTDMTALQPEQTRKTWIDMIPFKRMGTPDELAGAVQYLMSDASTYTSGCDIIIDGCFTCI